MALFQAWICVSNAVPTSIQTISLAQYQVLHTGGILATLVLIIAFRHCLVARLIGRKAGIVVSVAAVAGTLMTEVASQIGPSLSALGIAGTVLGAISTGALLALWGEGYASLGDKALQAKATLAAMIGCFTLYLFVSALPQAASLVLVCAFPLISTYCLGKLVRPKGHEAHNGHCVEHGLQARAIAPGMLEWLPDRSLMRLMLYVVLCSIPVSFLNAVINAQADYATQDDWLTVYSIMIVVTLGAICLEMALRKLNRSSLPVLIGVLVTVGLPLYFFLGAQALVVRIFMNSGYYLFVAVFYSYLGANTLLGRRAPFLVFCLGNSANTFGLMAGWAIGQLAASLWLPLASYIAIGIVYLVLLIGLYFFVACGNVFSDSESPGIPFAKGEWTDDNGSVRGGYGDNGDCRDGRGDFGARDGYGSREGYGSRGDFGVRCDFGTRDDFGTRGGYGSRDDFGIRGGYGDGRNGKDGKNDEKGAGGKDDETGKKGRSRSNGRDVGIVGSGSGGRDSGSNRGNDRELESSDTLFEDAVNRQCSHAAALYGLSSREEEILCFLVRGRSASSVAQEKYLSRNTVKTHIEHIYKKLGIHSREQLLRAVESVHERQGMHQDSMKEHSPNSRGL
jgi:DNA-binding CsgD family transcriptional regulator